MKNIILLGPKHCGKTSVGNALAEHSNFTFIDLDEEIEKQTGKTPRQLYTEGQEVFRKAETNSLHSLYLCVSVRNLLLIATGGGIVDNQEAVGLLKQLDAVKIYLNISADTAWQRISAKGELPPFLQTENPQETHRILHERRSAAYAELSDFTINADNKTSKQIAEEISKIL